MSSLSFTCFGKPISQGSKVRNRYGGMRESSKALAPWRASVGQKAGEAMGDRPMLTGPLAVRLLFFLPRPQSQYGTGRNAGTLKTSAKVYPDVAPDIDKATRAILDALTSVVYRSDAQVTDLHAFKRYGHPARVEVTVRELQPGGVTMSVPMNEQLAPAALNETEEAA